MHLPATRTAVKRFERELKEYCERRMADWQQELLDCSHWEKEELD